ncbi:hypothetical protein UlMin_045388 [Ulmus minor]
MGEEVKVFRTWSSPFALRVVWALDLKGIKYETIYEDLSNKSPLLLQYNPIHKKVPVLLHNSKPIAESLVILEYIEDTWKHRPLLPQDPHQRANARFWIKFGEDKVFPAVRDSLLKQGKEQEEAHEAALESFKLLEEELKGKKLFGGEEIGMVDIALGWLANLVSVLEEVLVLKFIDEHKFPLLSAWMRLFADIPVIKQSWPPRDKLVTKYIAIREARLATN